MSKIRSAEARSGARYSPGSPRPTASGSGATAALETQPPRPIPPNTASPPSTRRRSSSDPRAGPRYGSLEGVIPCLADGFDVATQALDGVAAGQRQRTERKRRKGHQSQHETSRIVVVSAPPGGRARAP